MFNALFSDAFEIYPHPKVSQGNLKSMENMKKWKLIELPISKAMKIMRTKSMKCHDIGKHG